MRRYLRGGEAAEVQRRPGARRLDEATAALAVELFETTAEGNAVVVADLLAEAGFRRASGRCSGGLGASSGAASAEVATVRFETAPGHQMQIDFGEKWVGRQGSG